MSALGTLISVFFGGWTADASLPAHGSRPAVDTVGDLGYRTGAPTVAALADPDECPGDRTAPSGESTVDGLGDTAVRTPDGLYAYPTGDCEWDLSHGPDPLLEGDDDAPPPQEADSADPGDAPGATNVSAGTTDAKTLRRFGQPTCASTDRFVAIYAIASDDQDDYAQNVSRVRDLITQMDGKLNVAAYQAGEAAHYRFACDQDGEVLVQKVRLSLQMDDANFTRLVNDLQSKGFNKSNEKYLVHYAAQPSTRYAGQGSVRSDSSDSSDNVNNRGPRYAFSYDRYSLRVYMHEVGHTLGAVQDDAPDASGAHHCRGGFEDIMCYNDGGPRWTSQHACGSAPSGQYWDWCNNDYFAIKPRSGYLTSHYNIANCYQRWTVYSWCGETPKPDSGERSHGSRDRDRSS